MNAEEITYNSTDLECYEFLRLAVAEKIKDPKVSFSTLVMMIYQLPEWLIIPALIEIINKNFDDDEKADLAEFMIRGAVRHIKSMQLEQLN